MKEYDNPILVLDAIIEKDNKILLIERGREPDKGKWAFPGGHADNGKYLPDEIQREVEEETGLKIELDYIVAVASDPKRDNKREDKKQRISVVFAATYLSGEVVAGDDASNAEWYDPRTLKEEEMAFDHFDLIKKYLNNKDKGLKQTYW